MIAIRQDFYNAERMKDKMAKSCRGVSYPKQTLGFWLSPQYVIKKEGHYRVGTITVEGKKMYGIEDAYTFTRYKTKVCALRHLRENLKIDKEMRRR